MHIRTAPSARATGSTRRKSIAGRATRSLVHAAFALLCALCGSYSHAAGDIAESLNAVRSRGCEGRAGLAIPLKRNSELDAVAREWSRGGRLRDALARTDYRMINSSSMFVQGTKDTSVIARTLSKNYCGEIVDPSFTEIGFHQQQDKTWVVVAKPFDAPAPGDAARISARALELVNAARARAPSESTRGTPPRSS